jgi:hypothetical protein
MRTNSFRGTWWAASVLFAGFIAHVQPAKFTGNQ